MGKPSHDFLLPVLDSHLYIFEASVSLGMENCLDIEKEVRSKKWEARRFVVASHERKKKTMEYLYEHSGGCFYIWGRRGHFFLWRKRVQTDFYRRLGPGSHSMYNTF